MIRCANCGAYLDSISEICDCERQGDLARQNESPTKLQRSEDWEGPQSQASGKQVRSAGSATAKRACGAPQNEKAPHVLEHEKGQAKDFMDKDTTNADEIQAWRQKAYGRY